MISFTILVTGGCGFIGSAVVRRLVKSGAAHVVNIDALTYAGNPDSILEVQGKPNYTFAHVDICDRDAVRAIIRKTRPNLILHMAAESHVDRSIDTPGTFLQTNVIGTQILLEEALLFWEGLPGEQRSRFRFHHVSTDEVYGDLGPDDPAFREGDPYKPSSPYAASKAASDHLVRAWHRTYGLPVVISNCSNNYGPYQFPEKLIPLTILKAIRGEPLPVYGRGENVRDWLFVEDHAKALISIATKGRAGETYHIGGNTEKRNIDVVRSICRILDHLRPDKPQGIARYEDLITFVPDRPGHDYRYAMDCSKITTELGWAPSVSFHEGLKKTVKWYLENRWWWQRVLDGSYRLERLGAIK